MFSVRLDSIRIRIFQMGKPTKATDRQKQSPTQLIKRIVSGGQTGVDRAALDVAIAIGIDHGGWCPLGRVAEDGIIPNCYQLRELASPHYSDRTKRNVIDSDATLLLYALDLQGGTFMTYRFAERLCKPCLKVRLDHPGPLQRVRDWLLHYHVETLNIAGPRASKDALIYQRAYDYLMKVFS